MTFNHENNQKAWVGGSQHKPNSQRNGKAGVEGCLCKQSGHAGIETVARRLAPVTTTGRPLGDDITGSGDGDGRFLRSTSTDRLFLRGPKGPTSRPRPRAPSSPVAGPPGQHPSRAPGLSHSIVLWALPSGLASLMGPATSTASASGVDLGPLLALSSATAPRTSNSARTRGSLWTRQSPLHSVEGLQHLLASSAFSGHRDNFFPTRCHRTSLRVYIFCLFSSFKCISWAKSSKLCTSTVLDPKRSVMSPVLLLKVTALYVTVFRITNKLPQWALCLQ